VRDHVRHIVDDMRQTSKPHFLEARTYRYRGHSMSDPATYRTKQEVARAKEEDPIITFRDELFADGVLAEEQYKEWQKAARNQASQSVDFADRSPEPPLSNLHNFTYANTNA
jgi:pyruvate dehydrogenase E1 component alpha subunit